MFIAPVVNRGDLIGCSTMFDLKRSGKVQVVFNLNGKQITEKELWIEHNQNEKRLYPFVGMGEEGVQVLAKVGILPFTTAVSSLLNGVNLMI